MSFLIPSNDGGRPQIPGSGIPGSDPIDTKIRDARRKLETSVWGQNSPILIGSKVDDGLQAKGASILGNVG